MSDDPRKHDPDYVELPTPTAWPIVTAFGLTLLFAGLVTALAVSVVGLICAIIGGIGWFTDVFPHPKHEYVKVRPIDQQPDPYKTSRRSVSHLKVGSSHHRARYPEAIHPYSAGLLGGLAGGAVMAVLAVAYGLIAKGSIWWPVNLLAAAAVPSLAEATPEAIAAFSLAGFIVAIIVHLALSVLIGLLYTVLLPMLPAKHEWFWGGIVPPLIWTALISASMPMINPALAKYVDWPWFILCQVAFGAVCGFVVFKTARVETMQSWSFAEKMGIEAQEKEK
jgi:hypothetical protein